MPLEYFEGALGKLFISKYISFQRLDFIVGGGVGGVMAGLLLVTKEKREVGERVLVGIT